jgi:hypothetical protein
MATITASVGRRGVNREPDVRVVQELLNRHVATLGLQPLSVDGRVGTNTIAALETFQRRTVGMANPDARVDPGGRTLAALNGEPGSPAAATTASEPVRDPNWPPRPSFAPLVTDASRAEIFGRYEYVHEPLPGNAENIRITGNWVQQNIVQVQLNMGPTLGVRHVQFHRLAAQQLQSLWQAWESAGLLDRVLTFHGAFSARYVRGSTRTLSNHAFGSAFDINKPWNDLYHQPALLGDRGCVRELVPIANEHGFYWGGHFNRLDGMHFEVARLMGAD